MDETKRLSYLEAMDIDVWAPKKTIGHPNSSLAPPDDEASNSSQKTEPDISEAWQKLQEEVTNCQACDLHKTRTQTVFGTGNPNADWLLIGEAPGQNEDLQGEPFVGKAGLLLNEMLRAINLSREQVYIANILKCRPPNNRDPKPEEVEACSSFLQRQIDLIKPKIILAVGRIAAQQLLKTHEPIGKLRGKIHFLDEIPVIVIYHPAYLLRSLLEKRKAWQDLQLALKTFRELKDL